MLAHLVPLAFVQGPGLLQHGVRHADFADVMEHARQLDALNVLLGQPQLGGDQVGVAANGLGVDRGAAVAQVDRLGQHEHRRQVTVGAHRRALLVAEHLSGHLGPVDRRAVATEFLRHVQRLVGGSQQLVTLRTVRGVGGHTKRHGDSHLIQRERVAHVVAQALGDHVGAVLVGFRQEQRELLAAHTRSGVDTALAGVEQGGEALKALIAGRVPEQVVDALEVVQVGDQQRAGAATATRAL